MFQLSKIFRHFSGSHVWRSSEGGFRSGYGMLLAIGIAVSVSFSASIAYAEDLPSIPVEQQTDDGQLSATVSSESLPMEGILGPLVPNVLTVGLDFQGSEQFVDSNFIPPDTMGAVGPDHIVELINGRFDVYDKTTGNQVDTASLDGFWSNIVGLTIPNFNDICVAGTCTVSGNACTDNSDCESNNTFDPRIVYDSASGLWFAISLDSTNPATGDNNIYVARSNTDDPRSVAAGGGGWQGVRFDADTVNPPEFHDYETLAVDADGLYTCTQDFDSGSGGGGVESCYAIPKSDLLQSPPVVTNMTRFESNPAGLPSVDGSVQPILDFGTSDGRAPLLGTSGGNLRRGNIIGTGGGGAALGVVVGITGDPGHANPPAARQPAPGPTIENVAPRLVSNVSKQGDSLWAVHAVEGNYTNSAVRWYEIDEASDTVLQTGLIEHTNQDFHEPSIAVNEFGHVVIGYTCSGPNLPPSACVSVGETVGGVTTFEAPVVIFTASLTPPNLCYYRDYDSGRNRWGDYSATVLDPADACTFWTFQEYLDTGADCNTVGPGSEGGRWGIRVTELTFEPPVITVPGSLDLPDTCSGDTTTATLNVCNTTPNTGPCANLAVHSIESSDSQFEVQTPTSGFPVLISPDFCFPFQVTFTPSGGGGKSATLTIESSDPNFPEVQVSASGTAGVPEMTATLQADGNFGSVKVGEPGILNLQVVNQSSICELEVADLARTAGDTDFSFAGPASGITLPAVLPVGQNIDLPLQFLPSAFTPPTKTATFTLTTDDPDDSPLVFGVSGESPEPDITVSGDLAFGAVCFVPGGAHAEQTVEVCNTAGVNDLSVDAGLAGAGCADFAIEGNPFPSDLSPDFCIPITVQYTPTAVGNHDDCDLVITSNDPDESPISIPASGSTPIPVIDVTGDQGFPPTVIQSIGACSSAMPFPIQNNGICPLGIDDVSISINDIEYSLTGLPSVPVDILPGELFGEGDLRTVFAPAALARTTEGEVSVRYVSDPITGATTTITRELCGEAVHTGARVLVTRSGVPLDEVKMIQIRRITANRNRQILKTVDVARNLTLQTIAPSGACDGFQYHYEYGTVSNPIQLLPGSYEIVVQARIDGRMQMQTVGFDVGTCGFNPTITVEF